MIVAACGCGAQAAPVRPTKIPAAPSASATVAAPRSFEDEIAALADVGESGVGYSPTTDESEFLPDPRGHARGTMVLGRPPPRTSPALTRLVEAGADAVPALLRHLEDARATKLPPMRAMMWQETNDEYDVNRRTTQRPRGTNVEDKPTNGTDYFVKVGDLCFVALGQIVNRRFAAVRYQPTGGLVISSPVTSAALRDAARAEWGSISRASLVASLERDFREPDYEERRTGALVRLGYYDHDRAKSLYDAELARPTYEGDKIFSFSRSLYAMSAADRARAFKTFATDDATRDGIEQTLFGDLETQEAFEQKRISPATAGSDYRARASSKSRRDSPQLPGWQHTVCCAASDADALDVAVVVQPPLAVILYSYDLYVPPTPISVQFEMLLLPAEHAVSV